MISRICDLTDTFELDPETHWIKAFQANGDFYLIEPSAALQLGIWTTKHTAELIQDQEGLNEKVAPPSDNQPE